MNKINKQAIQSKTIQHFVIKTDLHGDILSDDGRGRVGSGSVVLAQTEFGQRLATGDRLAHKLLLDLVGPATINDIEIVDNKRLSIVSPDHFDLLPLLVELEAGDDLVVALDLLGRRRKRGNVDLVNLVRPRRLNGLGFGHFGRLAEILLAYLTDQAIA